MLQTERMNLMPVLVVQVHPCSSVESEHGKLPFGPIFKLPSQIDLEINFERWETYVKTISLMSFPVLSLVSSCSNRSTMTPRCGSSSQNHWSS